MGKSKPEVETDQIQKLQIIVDTREPNKFVSLLKEQGFDVTQDALEVGDYVIGNAVIERKTVCDLFNSLCDSRLWSQLYKLRSIVEEGFVPFLLVVGDIPTYDFSEHKPISNSKYTHYLNSINSIELRSIFSYNVHFKWVQSESQLLEFFKGIFMLMQSKGNSKRPVFVKKENRAIMQIKSDMLSAIPLIGRDTADFLASRFSIEDLAKMTNQDLSELKPNGRKLGISKAKNIVDALTS